MAEGHGSHAGFEGTSEFSPMHARGQARPTTTYGPVSMRSQITLTREYPIHPA
jgi:hypothetical protein